MDYNIGWIKLHRKLLAWGWYSDLNVRVTFIHCLLCANYEEKEWNGVKIPRGSFVSSTKHMSEKIGISEMKLRTALKKLNLTNEVTSQSTTKSTMYTIVCFNEYQEDNKQNNKPITNEQQTDNKPITTTKEGKKLTSKEVKKTEDMILDEENNGTINNEQTKHVFDNWIQYRKEINKPIKSKTSLIALKEAFNSHSFETCKYVVNASIENCWQGLFWDKAPKENIKPIFRTFSNGPSGITL